MSAIKEHFHDEIEAGQRTEISGFKAFLTIAKSHSEPHHYKCKYCGEISQLKIERIDDWPECCGYLMSLIPFDAAEVHK